MALQTCVNEAKLAAAAEDSPRLGLVLHSLDDLLEELRARLGISVGSAVTNAAERPRALIQVRLEPPGSTDE